MDQLLRGHGRHVVAEAQRGPHLLADRHRLAGARPHPAALGDQRLVVVLPRRPGLLEEPLALLVRRLGVRVGVQQDVAVVEGGDELDVAREQHAVAEDVTGHVADADAGEVLLLAVHAHLAEVPLDRLPGAACGDAHRLVVVADRAAGGEGVAQPEAVVLGDLVGDVGEGRGALVRGHHEVGVVAVVPDDVGGGHGLAVDEVVGDVEQAADEGAVAGAALLHPGLAVGGGVGQLLGEEAALGADRHDHGVLHHLRLDQPQHLGAEVVAPVAPPQATPGDVAEAQVHALHARRVDEDLVLRPWLGQLGDRAGVELERQVGLGPPVVRLLVEVRAQGRLDDGEVGPEDAVLVEADDVVERVPELLLDLAGGLVTVAVEPRVEA